MPAYTATDFSDIAEGLRVPGSSHLTVHAPKTQCLANHGLKCDAASRPPLTQAGSRSTGRRYWPPRGTRCVARLVDSARSVGSNIGRHPHHQNAPMSTNEPAISHRVVVRGSDRSFGIVFAVVFTVIGLWPLPWGGALRIWALAVAFAFLAVAFMVPRWLAPLNYLWFRFG